jgi:RHS repeat-associated protein
MRWQYAYDDSNAGRLRAMASSNHDGLSAGSTTTATYDYNPSGDRVKRVEGAVTKLWSYDGHNIATAESSDNANVYSVYALLGGEISNAVARHDVNASSNSTTSRYYQYNHRGDVVAALDSGGGYLYKYEYDAYGNVTTKWNSAAGDAPTDGILFTGKDYDEDTGLYYFNARWYDPEIGRFLIRAAEAIDAEHPYAFCGNRPTTRVDLSGNQIEPISFCFFSFCITAPFVLYGLQEGISHIPSACQSYKNCRDATKALLSLAIMCDI